MLKCTGYFRGIECPYERGGQAEPTGESRCRRPYCHFRHGGARNSNNSGGAPELGYDPYSPDVPKPASRLEDGSVQEVSDPQLDILELERVNQAIEAVKSEVEREQKRYAELLETKKDYSVSEASLQASRDEHQRAAAKSDSFSTSKYNPGSYRLNNSTHYNPTPLTSAAKGSSKYTLDVSGGIKSKKSSLEYVPTIVAHAPKHPPATNKYVVDKSKPPTDLEYDPLSNYSARLLSKADKDQKRTKRSRVPSQEDGYTPSLKKPCISITSFEPLARFSDSEDDLGFESQPSPPDPQPSSLASQNVHGKRCSSTEKAPMQEEKDRGSRELREMAVQYDVEDIKRPEKKPSEADSEKNKADKPVSNKNNKGKETPKDKAKKKEPCKASSQDVGKKERSANSQKGKDGKGEEKVKLSNGERNSKEKVKKSKSDARLGNEERKPEKPGTAKKGKPQFSSGSVKTKNGEDSKRPIPDKSVSGKKDSKLKATEIKNGRHSPKTKHKDLKVHDSGKPHREKEQKASTPGNREAKPAPKQRSLSHVDLFGDESDEEEPTLLQPVPRLDLSSDSDDGDYDCLSQGNNEGKKSLKHSKQSKSRSSVSSVTSEDADSSSLEKYLDFDSDPMEECLRIFNESSDVKTEDKGRQRNRLPKDENCEDQADPLVPGQKRRISHVGKSGNAESASKPVIRPYRRLTAQEVCYQRIRQAQQQAAELVAEQKLAKQQEMELSTAGHKASVAVPGERKRIAHGQVGTPSTAAKPQEVKSSVTISSVKSVNGSSGGGATLKARTLTGMTSKTTTTSLQKRVAHAPSLQSASLKRPVIPTEFGAKVPTNVRQRYLNIFIDECLKFCSSEQEAFDKALSEEKVVYDRSTSRNIYLNVAVNTLKKLRSLTPGSLPPVKKTGNKKVVSHEAMLGGKLASKTSFSLNRSPSLREEDLSGATLYRKLKEYLLTEDQLKENGYPMPHPEKPGRAVIFTTEEKKSSDPLCRVCCRCGTEYFVSVSGNCIRKEECVHHWGRLRRQRVPGGWETHYNCCSGAVGSPGCQVAKQHVQDGRKEQLDGFVKTFEKEPPANGCPGTFALDCEMCYTKQGLELTRVTVINSELKVVYDTFVKPGNAVVDYNTRFSGVTEEDLENTQITLRDVQAVLLNMFSSETILIGHSLESDLFALKIIHCTVVDTAIVFPHRLGLPYKRALRTLMADYLKRIIQDSVDGHDSSEDACSCMELMVWKIKEDAKVKR